MSDSAGAPSVVVLAGRDDTDKVTFSDEHIAFASRCHRELLGPTDTAAWSPYSVASALGLLAAADSGADHADIEPGAVTREVMRLVSPTADIEDLRDTLSAAARVSDLTRSEHAPTAHARDEGTTRAAEQPDDSAAAIAVANRLWLADGLSVSDACVARLARWPGSRVATLAFASDAAAAVRAINDDIAETTHGLVRRVLPDGAVDGRTRAVLVNALWLKLTWQRRFARATTRDGTFHGERGDSLVPMMRASHTTVRLAATASWRLVVLSTVGDQVDVELLLPAGRLAAVPLAEAEGALDADTMRSLIDAATPTTVDLSMPRVRVTGSFALNGPLRALGVKTPFRETGGVRGLTTGEPLVVSRVDHACVLRVDEDGVEGAAATTVAMVAASIARKAKRVVVDRPYLVLVRHRATGAVYFMARVTDVS